jgi:septum site-determining protein MinC
MEDSSVSFKATVNGLIIIMNETDDFETIMQQINEKLDSSGRFFKGASINVKYRGRQLSKEEEERIREVMVSRTGVEIRGFEADTEQPVAKADPVVNLPTDKLKMKRLYFKGIDEGVTKFHVGTVRSGSLLKFQGNIVVIGDVNPGAEVVAAGNVVVMGTLRGIVHAGADGNKEAIVVAFNLLPTQLRIADVIARSPDGVENKPSNIPEMAFVKDNLVYIERFLPQYK